MGKIILSIHHVIVAVLFIFVFLTITGCASPKLGSPEAVALEQEKKQEATIEAIEETVGETPDWFLNLPSDQFSVYAVGTSTSSNLQLAMDKAVLSAKRSLADRINSILSSEMKEFLTEVEQGEDTEIISEVELVTNNLITEVDVAGYNQEDAKIISQDDKYRAYVLLQYPIINIRLIGLKNERDLKVNVGQ